MSLGPHEEWPQELDKETAEALARLGELAENPEVEYWLDRATVIARAAVILCAVVVVLTASFTLVVPWVRDSEAPVGGVFATALTLALLGLASVFRAAVGSAEGFWWKLPSRLGRFSR